MNVYNPLLNADSYKLSQYLQDKPNVTFLSAYMEARRNFGALNKLVFFPEFQKFLNEHPFTFTLNDVEEAYQFSIAHGTAFNKQGFIEMFHDCNGTFPIRIDAIPEGSIVEPCVPMIRISNTHPKYAWIVRYVETMIVRLWYPITVASLAYGIMNNIFIPMWEKTSDAPKESLRFKLHDFGSRGTSSFESAGIGAMAHLLSFNGSDTITGILYAMKYYHADVCGYSINASEHSTVTIWGNGEGELEFIRNHLKTSSGKPLIASVMDSFDQRSMIDNIIGQTLKQEIIDFGGTLVCRLDSGRPIDEVMYALNSLWNSFGGQVNSKGYKVIHPSVRILQGDGVNYNSISMILEEMEKQKFSIDNIAFGMGGKLLQGVSRDDFSFAYKVSSAIVNGELIDVFKSPKGDLSKTSKKGVVYVNADMEYTNLKPDLDMLQPVFMDGKVIIDNTFDEIRERVRTS